MKEGGIMDKISKQTFSKKDFIKRVLSFYDTNQRVLPWRESRNPYHIWVSEIMLQQTRVQTVIPYYNRFIEELPDIESLAKASDEVLYKLWEGIGYYSRVRNLRKAANQVLEIFGKELPNNRKDLETLSGIGPYTSGAIASIAFGKKNAAIDGNVLRIFARLYEIDRSIKEREVKLDIKKKVEVLLPADRIGDFNQGLMEVGATICLPNGKPKCYECPFNSFCKSYLHDNVMNIPKKNKKEAVPKYNKTVLLLKYKDSYAIEKRPDHGLLKSLYQFPMFEGHLSLDELLEKYKIEKQDITILGASKHKFTHLHWNMIGYQLDMDREIESYSYFSPDAIINNLTIPSAFKAYKKRVMEEYNE